jgi:hypothetical protein
MESQTIRVSKPSLAIVRELAVNGVPPWLQSRRRLIKNTRRRNSGRITMYYAGPKRLRAEAIAWAEYQGDVKLWETNLADGLEEWPNIDRSGSFDIHPSAGP